MLIGYFAVAVAVEVAVEVEVEVEVEVGVGVGVGVGIMFGVMVLSVRFDANGTVVEWRFRRWRRTCLTGHNPNLIWHERRRSR
jgi:hypothetical protein